jgi:pimeloyl-ACP methyl ester carboxylesterase
MESDAMRCRVGDIEVFYRECGIGRPLILLHGTPIDHRALLEEFEPFFTGRPGWRRIYPDLPGHGQTSAPESIRSHDDMVRVVSGFIDAVIPGERFCVAGRSYGAFLARALVHERSAEIDGLLMAVPALLGGEAPEHRVRHADPAFVAALRPDEDKAELVVWQSPELLEKMRSCFDTGVELADQAFLERLQGTGSSFDTLSKPFAKPTLIVTGRFDQWCGYRAAFEILDDYSLATYAVLDGAGHLAGLERPDLYRALVGDWLDRIEDETAGHREAAEVTRSKARA